MKLRLNNGDMDLAVRFGTSRATVSNIIKTDVSVLHEIILEGVLKEVGMTSQLRYKESMQKSLGECMRLPELLLMPQR